MRRRWRCVRGHSDYYRYRYRDRDRDRHCDRYRLQRCFHSDSIDRFLELRVIAEADVWFASRIAMAKRL